MPTAATRHEALAPAAATGAFGLDLIHAMGTGNLVLSPDSIATALAMAGAGAAGQTAAQIASTLHLKSPASFAAIGALQGTIANEQTAAAKADPKAPTLDLANALFLQGGFPVNPTFVSGLQEHFGAGPQSVDFKGDLSGSLKTINEWVSDHTNGIIPQLFESLPELTRLVLADAVYLKASWLYPFKPSETSPAPFYGDHHKYDNHHASTQSNSVQFMHETERLRYGSAHGYAAVDLPYRASTLSLLVVLPVGRSFGALQHQLSAKGLAGMVHGLSSRLVELSLPRFHLGTQTSLNQTLEALGMRVAFSEGADFSGITAAEQLKIALVEHAADFKVDEAGTEAAAATGVVVEPTSAKVSPRNAVVFNANHPFLFFLRDDRTGAVLFAGRLTSPASAAE
jgi:serpin B